MNKFKEIYNGWKNYIFQKTDLLPSTNGFNFTVEELKNIYNKKFYNKKYGNDNFEWTIRRIIEIFEKDEELSIKDIVEVSTLRRTAVVHHLKKLQDANILTATKKGKFVFYKINPEIVKKTCENTIDYVNKHLI